jgi:hypothetical protein
LFSYPKSGAKKNETPDLNNDFNHLIKISTHRLFNHYRWVTKNSTMLFLRLPKNVQWMIPPWRWVRCKLPPVAMHTSRLKPCLLQCCIGCLCGGNQNSLASAAPLPAENAAFGGGSNAVGAVGTSQFELWNKFVVFSNVSGSVAARGLKLNLLRNNFEQSENSNGLIIPIQKVHV